MLESQNIWVLSQPILHDSNTHVLRHGESLARLICVQNGHTSVANRAIPMRDI